MSGDDFLTRWSKRKRAVAKAERAPEPPREDAAAEKPPAPAETEAAEEGFDLSSLPPLESITGSTDVTAFLRRGVPADLTRAALRKAWSSDPAIRDFVGLCENGWDFNDPAAIPGFGPLDWTPEQVRQMAANLVGKAREVVETIEATGAAQQHEPQHDSPQFEPLDALTPSQSASGIAAMQKESEPTPSPPDKLKASTSAKPRGHGGALPR